MSKYTIETTFETVGHNGTLCHSVTLDKDGNPVSNAVTFVPGAIITSNDKGETTVSTGKASKLIEQEEKTAEAMEAEAVALLAKAKAKGKK